MDSKPHKLTNDGVWVYDILKVVHEIAHKIELLFCQWKIIYQRSKDLRLKYLWASVALQLWLVISIYHQESTCEVTGDICFMFPAITFLYLLLKCYWSIENHFSEVKKTAESFTYGLQCYKFGWLYVLIIRNQPVEWLAMFDWYSHPKHHYSHFQYVIGKWRNIFQKSKRPQTYLLMVFSRIANMAGYIFITKISLWSDWFCLIGVSCLIVVIFTFNMLLVNGKTFFRSQKHQIHLLMVFSSITIWLVIYFGHK